MAHLESNCNASGAVSVICSLNLVVADTPVSALPKHYITPLYGGHVGGFSLAISCCNSNAAFFCLAPCKTNRSNELID